MRRALLTLAALSLLGSSGGAPPARKVYIPLYGTMCLDAPPDANGDWSAGTLPILTAYSGRARLGPVQPGTCAWIDGYTARSYIQLWCQHTSPQLSKPAQEAQKPGGAAICPVPASQDFR